MKYIRTKNGKIFDTQYEHKVFKYDWNVKFVIDDNNLIVYDKKLKDRIANHGQILKQADTIEELCDEFVWKWNKREFPYSTARQYARYSGYGDLKRALRTEENYGKYLNDDCEIFGAIWTDKGLIYVAKMNKEGELELI